MILASFRSAYCRASSGGFIISVGRKIETSGFDRFLDFSACDVFIAAPAKFVVLRGAISAKVAVADAAFRYRSLFTAAVTDAGEHGE
ncbi:MAG: hypothetical protein [Siphoviridae sp. ctpQM7]|nr:MAG: hypothetical protein [Siphoviridae sp. ctpQM7]